MKITKDSNMRSRLMVFWLTAMIAVTNALAMAQERSKPQTDDVLRVNTDLVQTAITVVDKNGKFVDGLDRGQFLGYWMFIYHAKRDATGAPNLIAQTQVVLDGRVMLSCHSAS